MRRIRNPVYGSPVSRVRIPPSPPSGAVARTIPTARRRHDRVPRERVPRELIEAHERRHDDRRLRSSRRTAGQGGEPPCREARRVSPGVSQDLGFCTGRVAHDGRRCVRSTIARHHVPADALDCRSREPAVPFARGTRSACDPSPRCPGRMSGSMARGAAMAEREGFEPSIRDKTYTPLAGERLQPLGHLSRSAHCSGRPGCRRTGARGTAPYRPDRSTTFVPGSDPTSTNPHPSIRSCLSGLPARSLDRTCIGLHPSPAPVAEREKRSSPKTRARRGPEPYPDPIRQKWRARKDSNLRPPGS